jgi:hypothetical protein
MRRPNPHEGYFAYPRQGERILAFRHDHSYWHDLSKPADLAQAALDWQQIPFDPDCLRTPNAPSAGRRRCSDIPAQLNPMRATSSGLVLDASHRNGATTSSTVPRALSSLNLPATCLVTFFSRKANGPTRLRERRMTSKGLLPSRFARVLSRGTCADFIGHRTQATQHPTCSAAPRWPNPAPA